MERTGAGATRKPSGGVALVADPLSAVRGWIRSSFDGVVKSVIEVEAGWELLWHLAEQPVELVVSTERLAGVSGPDVLAMARTAGLGVPFLLILPFASERARSLVRRAGNAEIVGDWTDGSALRAARARLLGEPTVRRTWSGFGAQRAVAV